MPTVNLFVLDTASIRFCPILSPLQSLTLCRFMQVNDTTFFCFSHQRPGEPAGDCREGWAGSPHYSGLLDCFLRPFCVLVERIPALRFLCHFRTSEVHCYLTISSAGTVCSRVVGTQVSSCSTRTPASTGEKRLQGNSGPLCPSQGGVCLLQS